MDCQSHKGKDQGGGVAGQGLTAPEPSLCKHRENAAKSHYYGMTAAKMHGIGKVIHHVMPNERSAAAHLHHRQVQKTESPPQYRQYPLLLATEQIRQRSKKIRPANLAKDSPPTSAEQATVIGAIKNHKNAKKDYSCQLKPLCRFEIWLVGIPDQEKANYHEHIVDAFIPCHGRFCII